MTITRKSQNARVAITVTAEDRIETSVKAVFSDDLVKEGW